MILRETRTNKGRYCWYIYVIIPDISKSRSVCNTVVQNFANEVHMKLVPVRHEMPRFQAADVGDDIGIRKTNDLKISRGGPMREFSWCVSRGLKFLYHKWK
jgi:hypothetical protein